MDTTNIQRTANNETYISIHIPREWRSVYITLLSLMWMLTYTQYFMYNEKVKYA